MVQEPMSSNSTVHAGGYPQGGGYGGPPPGGGGFGPQGGAPGGGGGFGPPQGGGGGFGQPPAGGGGFGPPPGGGGFGPQGGGEDVNTTLPFILGGATFFCGCGIFAVIPLFLAYQAHQAKQQGDLAGAKAKAKTATMVGGGMLGLGIVMLILYVILNVVAAM